MVNIVSPQAKFSYNLIKGSVKDRQKFVSDLNEKFFDSIEPLFRKQQRCKLNDIKKVHSSVLPEKKKVDIIHLKGADDIDGASDFIYSDADDIIGYTLEIPTKRGKVRHDSFITLMHENTHVLESLTNPKRTALTQKLSKEEKYGKSRNNWFDNIIYNKENVETKADIDKKIIEVREKTEKFLRGKTNSDKIAHLQDARYELEEEKIAHDEQLKYARKLIYIGYPVSANDLKDYDKVYLFSEKIELLKSMTFEVISKVRSDLAKKQSSRETTVSLKDNVVDIFSNVANKMFPKNE